MMLTPEELVHIRLTHLAAWVKEEAESAAWWSENLKMWLSHGRDPGTAEERCLRARDAALSRGGKYLQAIRKKLRRVELVPHWSPPSPPPACLRYGSLLGPDYYRLVPEPLLHGIPDSERIYGSGYLARHPEVQDPRAQVLPEIRWCPDCGWRTYDTYVSCPECGAGMEPPFYPDGTPMENP